MEIEDSVAFNEIVDDYNTNIVLKTNSDLTLIEKLQKLKDLKNKLTKICIPDIKYREDQFADLLEYEINLINNQTDTRTSFGETIYNDSRLRQVKEFNMYDLNSLYTIYSKEYLFLFNPHDYVSGELKYINRTFYESNLYDFGLAFLISKHYISKKNYFERDYDEETHQKKKKDVFTNNIPAICEIFFSERNFIIDCNFDTSFPLLEKIIHHNQQVNPSFSFFGINVSMRYIEKDVNNGKIVKEFTAVTGIKHKKSSHYKRSLMILLYRKDNSIQLYAIDGTFDGNEDVKNVLENVLLINLQNKLKTYSNDSVHWVWEKPIFIGKKLHRSRLIQERGFDEMNHSSLVTLLLIDIINKNIFTNDVLRAIKNPKDIYFMTVYLKNIMISLERYFNHMKIEHYMIFLCNYVRYILQSILFHNNDKSLNYFYVDYLENKITIKDIFNKKPGKSPFIVKKLTEILNNKKYNSNTKNTILILKRFFVFEKYNFRILGIDFNNSKANDILNQKQKVNNVKYFLIPYEMQTGLSQSINIITMMSLINDDFFRIDQSDINNPEFTITTKGITREIPKKHITFVLLNYVLLYSNIFNTVKNEIPSLYYSVQLQNKPINFVTNHRRLRSDFKKNMNYYEISKHLDKTAEGLEIFEEENQTEGNRLLSILSAKSEEEKQKSNPRIEQLKEYLYDFEKSFEEYKGCQEITFKKIKKTVINSIKNIKSLNDQTQKEVIDYFENINEHKEGNDIHFNEIQNAELEYILQKYNKRVNKLKRRHIIFEKEINSIKLKIKKDLESAMQHQKTLDNNDEKDKIIYNMENSIPVNDDIQPMLYRINMNNTSAYTSDNTSANNNIQFTDINSAKRHDDENVSLEYSAIPYKVKTKNYKHNAKNKNTSKITPDNGKMYREIKEKPFNHNYIYEQVKINYRDPAKIKETDKNKKYDHKYQNYSKYKVDDDDDDSQNKDYTDESKYKTTDENDD